jgi:hypothetical protein
MSHGVTTEPSSVQNENPLYPVFFLLALSLASHAAFSWMGFNPTDDGFTLAYSRRILDGQIPHRDFIIIRPALSPLLHVPEVFFGGDYTFWISRLVSWLQFGSIAWAWVQIASLLVRRTGPSTQIIGGVIVFTLSVHRFYPLAWHTIDAIWLTSIGIWLCLRLSKRSTWLGYFVLGAATLCRQNFLLAGVIACFILGDYRKIKCWAGLILPGVLYLITLTAAGTDVSTLAGQLSSHTDLTGYGFITYIRPDFFAGVFVGYLSVLLIHGGAQKLESLYIRSLIYFSIILLIPAFDLYSGDWKRLGFYNFGVLAGASVLFIANRNALGPAYIKLAVLALTSAWSSSISIGYNSPVLCAGIIVFVMFVFGRQVCKPILNTDFRVALIVLVAVLTATFIYGRNYRLISEAPIHDLCRPIGDVFPGANLIYTNENTYDFLADLKAATESVSNTGLKYAILSDCPGWWAKAEQPNPLPIDWVLPIELNRRADVDKLMSVMISERGNIVYLISKVDIRHLAEGLFPRKETSTPLEYVEKHFTRVSETAFFKLYK